MKRIVIAGGTGFIGKYFTAKFLEQGHEVIIISRQSGDVQWTDEEGIKHAVNDADLVINLAGRSVDCRYNDANKEEILLSRVNTTRAIGKAITSCSTPPKLWINSSTATIYRHAEDRPMTEVGGEIGKGFSVDVAKAWEKSFFHFNIPQTRQVALRMAIVLGKEGVMVPLTRLTKFGLGGKQGKGTQMFSWIHIDDLFCIVQFLVDQPQLEGAFNCSSPGPVNNDEFMRTLRNVLKVPVGIPSPKWLLEIGAVIIRTETELLLKSRWVIPEKLQQAGYRFLYPQLKPALENILSHVE